MLLHVWMQMGVMQQGRGISLMQGKGEKQRLEPSFRVDERGQSPGNRWGRLTLQAQRDFVFVLRERAESIHCCSHYPGPKYQHLLVRLFQLPHSWSLFIHSCSAASHFLHSSKELYFQTINIITQNLMAFHYPVSKNIILKMASTMLSENILNVE